MLLSYHLYCHLHAIIVSSVLSSYIPLCSYLKFVITSLFNNDIFINDIFLYYMLLSYHLYYHQIVAHSLAEASSHHHIVTSSHHHIITSSHHQIMAHSLAEASSHLCRTARFGHVSYVPY